MIEPAWTFDWPLQDKVGALMTTRVGGLSASPYDSNNLGIYVGDKRAADNRLQLKVKHQLPSEPLWLKQVHGVQCLHAKELSNESEADAVWTDAPEQVLAIQTADCLPVVFASEDGKVVAAAHAGWRGLAHGVLENTLSALPVAANKVHCCLGVAIGPCCFEVGAEVRAAFVDQNKQNAEAFTQCANGKWLADLYLLARYKLQRAGVAAVYGGGACSACDHQRFFSYRRDGGTTGRMATLVWRR